ncbi:hypothetical protein PI125_g10836 [Phytophthora idaei]|nr:hypothetical protein PI125_g10836 [Phytophthora idaei]
MGRSSRTRQVTTAERSGNTQEISEEELGRLGISCAGEDTTSGWANSEVNISQKPCLLNGDGSLMLNCTEDAIGASVEDVPLSLLPVNSATLVRGEGSGATGEAPDLVEVLEVGLRCW